MMLVCFQKGHCSTILPFRLDLSGGKTLPELNETANFKLCAAYEIMGDIEECAVQKDVQVRNCGDHYIYYMPGKLRSKCSAAVCTQCKSYVRLVFCFH